MDPYYIMYRCVYNGELSWKKCADIFIKTTFVPAWGK